MYNYIFCSQSPRFQALHLSANQITPTSRSTVKTSSYLFTNLAVSHQKFNAIVSEFFFVNSRNLILCLSYTIEKALNLGTFIVVKKYDF